MSLDTDAYAPAWQAGCHPAMRGVMACMADGQGGFTRLNERPFEFGTDQPKDASQPPDNTLHSRSTVRSAEQLGC